MSSFLVVTPGSISKQSFVDASAHRGHLAVVYNQYLFCDMDPFYERDAEEFMIIQRPL